MVYGTYAEIAGMNLGHMDENGFMNVIAEFAPKVKNLKHIYTTLPTCMKQD